MKTLVGLLRPRLGQILIDGRDMTRLSPPQRALAGLGYVPQERNIFRNLTIGENLRIGFEFIRRKAPEKEFIAARDRVLDLFPDLSGRLNDVAGTLSGGQRQMLAMGCALIPGPTTLLLDEPSAGLSPRYVTTMLDAVAAVNRSGVTVIMIEQNLIEAMRVSHDVILLVAGEIRGKWDADRLPVRSRRQGVVSGRRQGENRRTRIMAGSAMMQALLNGLVSGLLIALPAIALSLTYGILNFANFSIGAMITTGAYLAYIANASLGAPIVLAAPLAAIGLALVAVVIQRGVYRQIRNADHVTLAGGVDGGRLRARKRPPLLLRRRCPHARCAGRAAVAVERPAAQPRTIA